MDSISSRTAVTSQRNGKFLDILFRSFCAIKVPARVDEVLLEELGDFHSQPTAPTGDVPKVVQNAAGSQPIEAAWPASGTGPSSAVQSRPYREGYIFLSRNLTRIISWQIA